MSGKQLDSLEQVEAEMQAEIEAEKGPVRTVSRKVIVPGTYGLITNGPMEADAYVRLSLVRSLFNEKELRAAAAIFIELADALALPLHEGSGS